MVSIDDYQIIRTNIDTARRNGNYQQAYKFLLEIIAGLSAEVRELTDLEDQEHHKAGC